MTTKPPKMRFRIRSWIIALLAAPTLLLGMTADELTSKTGIAGGLCSFPQATQEEVKLALELAKRPTFIVHVMAKTEAEVNGIRASADAAGVLGRSFYVEKGSVAKLPFADHLVDLLVISNMCEADLTPVTRAECLRVIQPVRGLSLVGNNGTAAVRPSKEKLGTWAGNLPLTKVQEDASGAWAWLRAIMPAGAEAWSHRLHDAASCASSMDTALQAPFITQWWGLPRQEGYWGSALVSCNGRIFFIRSNRLPTYEAEYSLLTARNANNGIVLWQKQLRLSGDRGKIHDGGFVSGRSCAVATMDSLFVVDGDGVLRLDAQTGAERSRIPGPKPNGQVKWIALEGNLLAVLSGEPDKILLGDFFKNMSKQEASAHSGDATVASLQKIVDNPMGREIAVYDMESGKMLWHETATGDIDERLIVIRDQHLYFTAPGMGVVCRDLKNGKSLWTNVDSDIQSKFNTPSIMARRIGLNSLAALTAYKDVLLLRSKGIDEMVALSPQNGAVLWKKPPPGGYYYRGMSACAVGDTWIGDKTAMNLKTGAETTGPAFTRNGCGPTTSTPNYVIAAFGRVTEVKTNRVIRTEDDKSPCDMGTIVSEGLMINPSSICNCSFEIKGYRVLASAGNIKLHTAPPWKQRLTVFDTAEPAPLNIIPADWPTYRHDPQRSAGSAAAVGEQPKKILWQWKPRGMEPYSKPYAFEGGVKPDFLATASVSAEGLVWFGAPDGTIRCVKADTGAEVWSFATGGMLFKPPTLWQGRLLAGGGDGNVYCLDARTGKCLWRLLAAPSDRRIFWYGHLINTWPVLPGVVVQDNIAYTVAGYQKENGVHAYAFDPKTGQVFWEKDAVGSIPSDIKETDFYHGSQYGPTSYMNHSPNNKVRLFEKKVNEWAGLPSYGGIAVGMNKLWLPAGCIDLKTGVSASYGERYGSEVGVFDKWVAQGGRRISETESTLEKPTAETQIIMSSLASNEGAMTGVSLFDVGISLPAWDSEAIFLPPPQKEKKGGSTAFYLLPRAKFTTWLTEYAATYTFSKKGPDTDPKPTQGPWMEQKQWATDEYKGMQSVAFALAKDQAVVALVNPENHSYKLCGYLRASGKQAWTIDLPEQPAMNRLALDRNGRILVSLCDGSVICVGQ